MSMIAIRRVVSTRDEIFHEGGAPRAEPLLVGTIAVALENPYAGSYFDDILPFMEDVGQALRVTAFGIAIGLVLAFFISRLMESTLFGVIQLDAVTFAVLATALASVSVLAGYVPARRALAVDPAIALRAE